MGRFFSPPTSVPGDTNNAVFYDGLQLELGDVATSYADPSKANAELGWRTTRSVEEMCADSWRWQEQNPNGYPDA